MKTIRLPGKNHRIPREIVPFVTELEHIEGVEKLGYGEFVYKGSCRAIGAEVRLYDETSRTLKVRINHSSFRQIILLTIDPSERSSIENFVENYRF
jgi:hypothetical protein